MSKFNNSKKKIEKLSNYTEANKVNLVEKDNSDILKSLNDISKQSTNKKIVELYNSDYELANIDDIQISSGVPYMTEDENGVWLIQTVNKNTVLPIGYNYNKTVELDIPENLLPFIKIIPEVKSIPNYDLTLGQKFIGTNFSIANDVIQIKGDGSILYKGSPRTIDSAVWRINKLLSAFTRKELDEHYIPLQNTKKIYKATVIYTDGGEQFKIEGNIVAFGCTIDLGASCDPSYNNRDRYYVRAFQDIEQGVDTERHDNEFLVLTASTFSVKAQKIEYRYIYVDPDCNEHVVETQGATFSSSFSLCKSYWMQIVGRHTNLTTGKWLGDNQKVDIDTTSVTINSQTFEHTSYRAYYDNKNQGILSTKDTGNLNGTYAEFELDNLPSTDDSHVLTYNNITFLRNSDFDRECFEIRNSVVHSKFQPCKSYFYKKDGKFLVSFSGDYFLKTPVNKIAPESIDIFARYNDTYANNGISYTVTKNHSFIDTPTYIPEVIDSEIKFRIVLQNPLYWKEDKKYNV